MERTVTRSEKETLAFGRAFAQTLQLGDVVAVFGDLGTGKTRFIKGICDGLGIREHVASPTFTIVNEYVYPGGTVYHFDFYRIESLSELREIGFEEYLERPGICVIEWADRVLPLLPERRYNVMMNLGAAENEREIWIEQQMEVVP